MTSSEDGMNTRPLLAFSGSELVAAYRSGELDPVMAVEACLARIDELNPVVNALVFIDRRAALQAAEASRERWKAERPLSELDGVPVTVKDNLFVAGMPATWGSRLFADFVPDRDDLPVARLRGAGLIILGKTNTPEFAMAGHTNNLIFGRTRNPWDRDLTPGGSSGGAVAAIMAGFAPLAIATDAGGSIRRPASHVGCIGLKPSTGTVDRRFGFPPLAADLQAVGALARTSEDVGNLLALMAGALPIPKPLLPPLRIAAFADIDAAPVDQEVIAAYQEAKEKLRSLGHDVVETASPYDPDEINEISGKLTAAGVARVRSDHLNTWNDRVDGAVKRAAEIGAEISAVEYVRLLESVTAFRWKMSDFFSDYDVILTPTAAALPWKVEEPFPDRIDGLPVGPRASAIYTTFVNVAGLPAISIPFASSQSGLPIGMQLVAANGHETLLLDLARGIESRWPWARVIL